MIKYKLLLLLLLISLISEAQIQGIVIDVKNKPVEFANVILCKYTGEFIVGTSTDINGKFEIEYSSKLDSIYLEISFIGYKTVKYQFTNNKFIKVKLLEDRNLLSEVEIVSKINPIRVKGNKIIANVVGTVLERETSVMELLSKIPSLTLDRGRISSFFGGKLLIYINGRKLSSIDEIRNLDVKSIKNIQLINNPESKYDASVKTILLITTQKKLDGLSVQVSLTDEQAKKNSHDELFNINFNREKWNISASYAFSESNNYSNQDMFYEVITKDTLWNNFTNYDSERLYSKNNQYSFGVDYSISKNHKVSFKYDGNVYSNINILNSFTNLFANNTLNEKILGKSIGGDDTYFNHANLYYFNKMGSFEYEIYGDFVNSNFKRRQDSKELRNNSFKIFVNSYNKSEYDIIAINQNIKYSVNKKSNILLGFECSFVNGENSLDYKNSIIKASKSETFERKLSGFIDYNISIGDFSLQAGIRFEDSMSKYTDMVDLNNNIQNRYKDFFPSFNISYSKNNITNALSYRSGIKKPIFDMMTSYSFYINKYLYQIGNSDLKSQISHDIKYSFTYKYFLLQLGYSYYDNYIGMTFMNKDKNSPIVVSTMKNYNKSESLSLILNLNYRFGFYEPNITLSGMKNVTAIRVGNTLVKNDKPIYFVNFNNYMKLPKEILLNINYQYNSGGSMDFFELGETSVFNFSIKKSFFKNNLSLSFSAKDIFRDNISHICGKVDNVSMKNINEFDMSSYSINLIWRFNNYKSSYRGRSAADSEISRL